MDTDAHPPPRHCHSDGHTGITFTGDGSKYCTGGVDNAIRVFQAYDDEDAVTIDYHSDPVTCLCAQGNQLVTGSADNTVALFDLRKNAFEQVLTRFTAPVSDVAFNKNGSSVVTGSEDHAVKVISLMDQSCKVLSGHDGPVLSVGYDPESEYVVSTSADGSVKVWNLLEEKCVSTLSILIKSNDKSKTGLAHVSWQPSGRYFAVPVGRAVQVVERDSWEPCFRFSEDGHNKPVSICAWSPNGEYLASVSVDGEIMIWETSTKTTIDRYRHPDSISITSLCWKPQGNEIAWADNRGKFSVWRTPIPDNPKFAKAAGGEGDAQQEVQELQNLFSDDDEEVSKPRRRLKRSKKRQQNDDEDDEEGGIESSVPKGGFIVNDEPQEVEEEEEYYARPMEVSLQPPFQPSSTPVDGMRRFLVWNHVGVITSREDETACAVDVEFHNAQKHRPIRITDHFGFTMASLSQHAFAMGGPSRIASVDDEREHPSILFCQIIDHWANDTTWQVFFPPGEEIEAIAVGEGSTGFVAAATDKRYVRLYSTNGIAKHMFCLDGPVVCMAAHDGFLAIAYHHGHPLPDEQPINIMIFDVDKRKVVCKQPLPLSPKAELAWLGFSESGLPVTMDSQEVVRAMLKMWDNTWTPMAELKSFRAAKNKDEYHWITSVSETEVMSVVCKSEKYPKVLPRPILTATPLRIPLVSLKDVVGLEEKFCRNKINFEHAVDIEELDEFVSEDRRIIRTARKRMDHSLMGCISRAVQGNRPGRALDLTTMLTASTSIDIAIKLAVKAKMPMLAERMSLVKAAFIQAENDRFMMKESEIQTVKKKVPNSYLSPPEDNLQHIFDDDEPEVKERQNKRKKSLSDDHDDEPVSRSPKKKAQTNLFARSKPVTTPKSTPRVKGVSSEQSTPVAITPLSSKNPFARKTQVTPVSLERSTSFVENVSSPTKATQQKRKPSMMFLKQAEKPLQKKVKKQTAAQKKKEMETLVPYTGPKKPLSSYFMWMQDNRERLKKEYDLAPKEIMKKAGELWKSLSDNEKKPWDDKYAAQKEEYRVAREKWKLEVEAKMEAKEDEGKEKEETVESAPEATLTKEEVAVSDAPTEDLKESTDVPTTKAEQENNPKDNLDNSGDTTEVESKQTSVEEDEEDQIQPAE